VLHHLRQLGLHLLLPAAFGAYTQVDFGVENVARGIDDQFFELPAARLNALGIALGGIVVEVVIELEREA